MLEVWNFIMENLVWVLLALFAFFVLIGIIIANFSFDNYLSGLEKYRNIPTSFWGNAFNFGKYISESNFGGVVNISEQDEGKFSNGTYSPANYNVSLSSEIIYENSIAAISTVAHELGHASQHLQNPNIMIKNAELSKAVSGLGTLNWVILILATALSLIYSFWFAVGGFALILINFIVAIILKYSTIKLEKDASLRAIKILEECDLFTKKEITLMKKFLNLAKKTYVADFLSALLGWTGLTKRTKYF